MEKISVKDLSKFNVSDLKGKVIVFHTDTVYGIGALLNDEEGIEKIYKIKHRDERKILPVLCADIEQVESIAIMNENAMEISKYWPGALTMILKMKSANTTVACRIPNSDIARSVLRHFGPLRTTSVNISGEKELNSVDEIINIFGDKIDYIITEEDSVSTVPSTIIDVTQKEMKILRVGSIKL